MKKFISMVLLVMVLATMATAYAECLSFEDFCLATEIGDVVERDDGTCWMEMKTINGYAFVATADGYDVEEAEMTVTSPDGSMLFNGTVCYDDAEETMMVLFTTIYYDYVESFT